MSRPRFLADEDLRFEIVLAARRLEPTLDLATVQELGRDGSSDEAILAFASAEGLIVVSHDVNTPRAVAERRLRSGAPLTGVLLTAQRNRTRPVAESIVLIAAASEAEEWQGRIVFLPF